MAPDHLADTFSAPAPNLDWHLDYYRALIPDDPFVILDSMQAYFGASMEPRPRQYGRYNYRESCDLIIERQKAGNLYWSHPQADPMLEFSSHHAELGAQAIRSRFPIHQVSRADVAIMFDYHDAYDHLETVALSLCHQAQKHPKRIVSDTRTIYAPKKYEGIPGFTRIYEWGKKNGHDPRLVRVEHETHPQDAERYHAATWQPVRFASYTALQHAINCSLDVASQVPAPKAPPRYRDLQGRIDAMTMQYKASLRELLDNCGQDLTTWAAIIHASLDAAERPSELLRQAGAAPLDQVQH